MTANGESKDNYHCVAVIYMFIHFSFKFYNFTLLFQIVQLCS